MKKASIVFWIFIAVGCFCTMFYFAFEKNQKTTGETQKIHAASKVVVDNYLNHPGTLTIHYPSSPIFYEDRYNCILVCFGIYEVSGVKYRTQFNILLSREAGGWKAEIVKVKRKRDGNSK